MKCAHPGAALSQGPSNRYRMPSVPLLRLQSRALLGLCGVAVTNRYRFRCLWTLKVRNLQRDGWEPQRARFIEQFGPSKWRKFGAGWR